MIAVGQCTRILTAPFLVQRVCRAVGGRLCQSGKIQRPSLSDQEDGRRFWALFSYAICSLANITTSQIIADHNQKKRRRRVPPLHWPTLSDSGQSNAAANNNKGNTDDNRRSARNTPKKIKKYNGDDDQGGATKKERRRKNKKASRHATRQSDTMETATRDLASMPPEIIDRALSLLGDADFCRCLMASRLWHTYSAAGYARRIVKSPGWTGPRDLIQAGNAAAIRGLVAIGRIDLAQHAYAPRLAASRGHLDLVMALYEMNAPGFARKYGLVDCAVDGGSLPVLAFLQSRRVGGCTTRAMNRAAARGRLDLVRFLHHHRSEGCTRRAMDYAAANGHKHVVVFLHRNRTEGCSVGAVNRAAANGHLDVVTYLLAHRSEGWTLAGLAAAAARGDLAMLHALIETRTSRARSVGRSAIDAAAANGHMAAVIYLSDKHGQECTADALVAAAKGAHFDIVDFLVNHRLKECVEGLHHAADAAFGHGRVDVAQRLLAHSRMTYAPSQCAFLEAATGGHTPVLRVFYANHRAVLLKHLDEMLSGTVGGGHADAADFCIDLLRRHFTGPDGIKYATKCASEALVLAAAGGSADLLPHVERLGHFMRALDTTRALEAAAANGHLEFVRLLCDRSTTHYWAIRAAAVAGHVHIITWFFERVECRTYLYFTAAIDGAAQGGHVDLIAWLADKIGAHFDAWYESKGVSLAFANGHMAVLRLLLDPAFAARIGGSGRSIWTARSPDATAWQEAASAGHLDAIRYIHTQGIPMCHGRYLITGAIASNHLDIIKFAYRTMPLFDPAMALTMAQRHSPPRSTIVAWLLDAIRHGAYRPPAPREWDLLSAAHSFVYSLHRRRTGKTAMVREMIALVAREQSLWSAALPLPSGGDRPLGRDDRDDTDGSSRSWMEEVD
jgi:ankyrin repeat protein